MSQETVDFTIDNYSTAPSNNGYESLTETTTIDTAIQSHNENLPNHIANGMNATIANDDQDHSAKMVSFAAKSIMHNGKEYTLHKSDMDAAVFFPFPNIMHGEKNVFLGPMEYKPRRTIHLENRKKAPDPWLRHNSLSWRNISAIKYQCSRYQHPLLQGCWLTEHQSKRMVSALNASFPSQFANKSCPAFFKIGTDNNSSSPTISFHHDHLCDVHDHGHLAEETSRSINDSVAATLLPDGPIIKETQSPDALQGPRSINDSAAATLLSDGPIIKETQSPDALQGHVPHVGSVIHNVTTGTFVQADDRIPVHIISQSPEVPWIEPQDIIDLKLLFEKYDTKLFHRLVGGSSGGQKVRLFTPELTKFPDVYALVQKCIAPYLHFVQTKYPSLQHFKLAALKSMPGAASQYSRCFHRLHCDYDDRVNLRPPHDRPVSLMVALDPFEFLYLKSRNDRRRDLITQVVHPGQAIAFTNYCLHAGGANHTPNEVYRLFAYIASDPHDIPTGRVFQHRWIQEGDDVEDDRIGNVVVEAEANDEPTEVIRTVPGRSIVAPNRYGFPNHVEKKQKTTKASPAVSDKLFDMCPTTFNFSIV
jgi:hypothetical protein